MFPANRDLNLLTPDMKAKVEAWLVKCKAAGLSIIITEGKRSKARQFYLWSMGRSPSKAQEIAYLGYDDPAINPMPTSKAVTWTLQSNHLTGKAIDFAFLDNGKLSYNGNWDLAYDLAESVGISSLFRTKGIDRPHLELLTTNLKELEERYAQASKKANDSLQELNNVKLELSNAKGIKFLPLKII